MRVIVTGDRHWYCLGLSCDILRRLVAQHGPGLVVIHGAAPGVDSAFDDSCTARGVAQEPHPADWKGKGRGAGPIRNQAMVDAGADLAIAVHRNLAGSRGTKDCVRRCLKAGIPVWLIDSEACDPRRITEV